MPTFIHGKASKVLLDEFDLSSFFNSLDVAQTLETAETTSFGSSAKSYIPGLADATLSLSGMFSQDSDGSDEELSAILGATTTPLVTVLLDAGTIGNSAIVAKAHETNYAISSPVGDIVSVTADFNASTDATSDLKYGLRSGKALTAGSSIAFGSLGNLASVDNAASSANGGMVNLHVTANSISGGATTIKVQHSTNNSTWADLVTFAAVSASTVTTEQAVVTGTVNRYLRATASTAGSSGAITFHIAFARF